MKVCIECEKPVEGKKAVRIKEDNIIQLIRSIKRVFKAARENELYVCEDDLQKHIGRRDSFNKALIFFGLAAVVVVVLAAISMVLSGNLSISGLLLALIIGIFLVLFAVVFKYAPDVESKQLVAIPGVPAAETKAQAEAQAKKAAPPRSRVRKR